MRESKKQVSNLGNQLNRRQFFGLGLFGALASGCATRGATMSGGTSGAEAAVVVKQALDDNIYTRMLGLKPHLPAMDHITYLGGSRMPSEVMQAMLEANEQFVDMHELTRAAGARLAEVLGAEAALVTSGSFSAMILGAAACLTGNDEAKIDVLPHPTWSKIECLTQTSGRFGYDRAYRAAGMTMVNVETREQFANAINSNTAMISGLARLDYETEDDPKAMKVHELLEFGRRARVPVIVDAASELPPTNTLTRWVDAGADLVVISGGKGIQGPQSTGILAGRRDLIEAATLHSAPNANLGRGMKVGKEEIMGFLVALDRYVGLDHDRVYAEWRRKAEYIARELQGIPGLMADVPQDDRGKPRVNLTWDENTVPLSAVEVREGLKNGDPRIAITGQSIQTRCMNDGEEILVAQRTRDFFSSVVAKVS
jgi:L-seryl-tRNA(Ser) seleniumtransferase|tara:strand:- start:697 stop:1977 length:1281 start_codon:yes stop_codon:yes gene_type:complete